MYFVNHQYVGPYGHYTHANIVIKRRILAVVWVLFGDFGPVFNAYVVRFANINARLRLAGYLSELFMAGHEVAGSAFNQIGFFLFADVHYIGASEVEPATRRRLGKVGNLSLDVDVGAPRGVGHQRRYCIYEQLGVGMKRLVHYILCVGRLNHLAGVQ